MGEIKIVFYFNDKPYPNDGSVVSPALFELTEKDFQLRYSKDAKQINEKGQHLRVDMAYDAVNSPTMTWTPKIVDGTF